MRNCLGQKERRQKGMADRIRFLADLYPAKKSACFRPAVSRPGQADLVMVCQLLYQEESL